MDYYQKYLKYKTKYLDLKEQLGGLGNPCKKHKDTVKCNQDIKCIWRDLLRKGTSYKGKVLKKDKPAICKVKKCKHNTTQDTCTSNPECRWKTGGINKKTKQPKPPRCKKQKKTSSKSSSPSSSKKSK